MTELADWQKEIVKQVYAATPVELFDMYCKAAVPDDYDGMHTPRLEWERDCIEKAMREWIEHHSGNADICEGCIQRQDALTFTKKLLAIEAILKEKEM